MFEQLKVYHVKYKDGIIVKFNNENYEIDFNGFIRKIKVGNWLKSLFLFKKDAYRKKENIDLSLYEYILQYEEDLNIKSTNKGNRNMARKNVRKDRVLRNFWVEEDLLINDIQDDIQDTDGIEETDENMYGDYHETGFFAGYYPGKQGYELYDIVHEAYLDEFSVEYLDDTIDKDYYEDDPNNEIGIIKKKYVLEPSQIDREEERSIIIIYAKPVKTDNKKYIKIVGIDIKTAKVVTIVDTNGKHRGLHSYDFKMRQIIEKTVILKAQFEYLKNTESENALRIVSDYKIICNFNISSLDDLNWKYYTLSHEEISIIMDFDKAKIMLENNKRFYMLINFTDTIFSEANYKKNICIKMKDIYPIVNDKEFLSADNLGMHYIGIGLVSWFTNRKGENIAFVEKLYGKAYTEDEMKEKRNKEKGSKEGVEILNEDPNSKHEIYRRSFNEDPGELYPFNEYTDEYENLIEEYIYEEDIIEIRKQEDAYWFSDDEYVIGSGSDEDI